MFGCKCSLIPKCHRFDPGWADFFWSIYFWRVRPLKKLWSKLRTVITLRNISIRFWRQNCFWPLFLSHLKLIGVILFFKPPNFITYRKYNVLGVGTSAGRKRAWSELVYNERSLSLLTGTPFLKPKPQQCTRGESNQWKGAGISSGGRRILAWRLQRWV